MLLRRWDPFASASRFNFPSHGFPGRSPGVPAVFSDVFQGRWHIPIDVVEEGEDLVLRASVPGLKPEDIEVTIEDGVLTIKGQTDEETETKEGGYLMKERRSGSFQRSLRLPASIDPDQARSGCENGVLTIHLPKAEEKKAKRLEITTGKA